MSLAIADAAPPVALHELASKVRIQRIELLPMLCTAAIGPVDGGYVIYINTTANGSEQIRKGHLDVTEEDFRCLNNSLRFSVAHEIAHVFFFNSVGGDCRNTLLQDHWRALENSCSQMARVMLLPAKALVREIGNSVFAPGRLLEIVRRFKVSPAVFIYRLNLDDMRSEFRRTFPIEEEDGLIACIHMRRNEPAVIASQPFGVLGHSRWGEKHWSPEGAPLKSLCLCANIAAILNRRENALVDADVFWREGQFVPSTVEIQWYNRVTCILSIHLRGYIEKR